MSMRPSETTDFSKLEVLCSEIRQDVAEMCHRAHTSHIASCLSEVEILVALYFSAMQIDPSNPTWPDRDRYIQSKGHACAALYSCLARRGFFPQSRLLDFAKNGKGVMSHVDHQVPGVEVSTGSLGHGLPIGVGMCLAARSDKQNWRTFVLLSDGECDEGSVWEAAMAAAHFSLDNLIVLIDANQMQATGRVEEVMKLEPLGAKFEVFGWAVREVDGHDVEALVSSLREVPFKKGRPSLIVAHTTKGKGISFMENDILWHYKSPDATELARALEELRISKPKGSSHA